MPLLDDDFDSFEAGIVSSLFAIELMTFLEKNFNIKVTMDDLDMQNFKLVNAASRFVRRTIQTPFVNSGRTRTLLPKCPA